jgi:hypothetical protein
MYLSLSIIYTYMNSFIQVTTDSLDGTKEENIELVIN